jgi:NAD(P)-dependent dehydrogenase (short-subunit alcohol dehydrogenase family)
VRTHLLDVTDFAQVTVVAQDAIRDFGTIHVVVNNAGFAQYGPLETSSLEQIRAQFETNDFGLIAVSKAFIPHLRERAGTIINLATLSAKIGFPIFSVYSSSKAAVAVLSEALAVELAPFDVKFKAIFPGTHATQIFNKMDAGLEGKYQDDLPYIKHFLEVQRDVPKVSLPENIARVIWQAATDQRSTYEYVGGCDAKFLIGLKRWLPQVIWKQMQVGTLLRPASKYLKVKT